MSLIEVLAELPACTPTVLFENEGYILHGTHDPTQGWSLILTNKQNRLPIHSHGKTPEEVIETFSGDLRYAYAQGCMGLARLERGLQKVKEIQKFLKLSLEGENEQTKGTGG